MGKKGEENRKKWKRREMKSWVERNGEGKEKGRKVWKGGERGRKGKKREKWQIEGRDEEREREGKGG